MNIAAQIVALENSARLAAEMAETAEHLGDDVQASCLRARAGRSSNAAAQLRQEVEKARAARQVAA